MKSSKTVMKGGSGVQSFPQLSPEFKPFGFNFKGTVQRDFRPQIFFHNSNLPVPLTNGLVSSILVKNSLSYSNFKSENLTPRGIIPRRVNLPGPRGIIPLLVNLPEVSYPSKSIKNPLKHDSPRYHTPASQFFRH